MLKRKFVVPIFLLICMGGILSAGAWVVWNNSQKVCLICTRQINPRAHVIVEINGKKMRVCCVRCALTEGQQEHTSVRIVAVTDYPSGQEIDPQRAWFVEGSRVMPCAHAMDMIGESRRANRLDFDRCAPSTLAFSRLEDAETLVAQKGGVIRSLNLIIKSLSEQPAASGAGHRQD